MDQIREFDAILNKENRDVVADDIPITLLGVESTSKTSDFSRSLRRTSASEDRGKTDEHRHLGVEVGEDFSMSDVLQACVELEKTVCSITASVNNAF